MQCACNNCIIVIVHPTVLLKTFQLSAGKPVLGIQIFLGLPDPDTLVRGTDSDLNPPFSHKGVERTEILLAKCNFNTKCSKKLNF